MNTSKIEGKLTDAIVLMERADAISTALSTGFFEHDIKSLKDTWKVSGPYYDNAKILAETIQSMILDAKSILTQVLDENLL